ncbi:thiopeptide-type bacteriocin biosynthesis protein [uncultured Nonlabens sp.]|uniref:thiopeptide-type bacteriocin biosynthesis protein n=1 Tax=uncultured Nonlabens sp. TaxID=859306 RepID=UPI002611D77B|nr:thiopeptide-type bacteriocin biosynthesis protein [uncultured Nonlabens sp.]
MIKEVQRTFSIGDTWLYYKIYCGTKTADDVLLQVIQPLTMYLWRENCIEQWFFIRYADPDPHLRVRFKYASEDHIQHIMTSTRDAMNSLIKNGQLWDVQLATYNRELERYGPNTIKLCEKLFFYDSQQVLEIMQHAVDDTSRFINCFHWVSFLISQFELHAEEQLAFLDRMQIQFKEEFDIKKEANKQLNQKYKGLESLLFKKSRRGLTKNDLMCTIIQELLHLEEKRQLEVSKENLLASFIHMTINRTFKSQQRLHEMMLYDFLNKMNKSKMARYGKL